MKRLSAASKYTLLFEESRVATSIFSLDRWVYREVNQSFLRHTGYTREELVERPGIALWVDETERDRYLGKLKASGTIENFEFRYRKKDGTVRVALGFGKLIELDGEQCILAENFDITRQKELEKAAGEHELMLRTLTENFPGFIYTYRLQPGKSEGFLYASPGVRTVYGVEPDALVADRSIERDLIPENERCDFEKALAESARKGTLFHREFRIRHPKKGERWLETRALPEAQPDGSTIWHGVTLDVTDRKTYQLQAELVQTAICHSREAMYIVNPKENFRFVLVNDAACRMSGYDRDTLLTMTPMDLDPTADLSRARKTAQQIASNGNYRFESIHRRKDGTLFPIENHAYDILFDGKHLEINIVRDISERKRTQEALAAKEQEFRTLAENTPDTIARYDRQLCRTYANPTFARMAGIPAEALLGKRPTDYNPTLEAERYEKTLAEVFVSERGQELEYGWPDKDGKRVISHIRIVPERNRKGEIETVLAVGRDITLIREAEERIAFLAHHDALTRLPNRILARERMIKTIERANHNHRNDAALLFIDLDGFKTINDTLGHSVGDAILVEVADRLNSCIGNNDMISRQGGDEFLMILSDIRGYDDAAKVAEIALQKLEQPFLINKMSLSTSVSVGIAIYPKDGETFETLLQKADAAMYKAKESGKNTYRFYTDAMNNNLAENLQMRHELKDALSYGEFVLYYQPQVNLVQNRIVGVEALLRWKHPTKGMISPEDIIPVAESNGMIIALGEWILAEACRQAARWHEAGMQINVAVNISAIQFKRGNLETIVQNALADSGLAPEYLELELTESIMIHDTESILSTVKNLKKMGIQLSIDDFGTGYSSLSYLKRFAVDKLKIDRSFVRDILKDQEDEVIVRTIVQMAKSLGLKTIAEGVENIEVLSLVREFGCDEVQGYHFAKPMEAAAFEQYFLGFKRDALGATGCNAVFYEPVFST